MRILCTDMRYPARQLMPALVVPVPCVKLGPDLPKEVIEHEPFLLCRVRLWPRNERDLAELALAAALVASEAPCLT